MKSVMGQQLHLLYTSICHELKLFLLELLRENDYDADHLILALNYIDENIDCKIINISLGITCSGNLSELKSVCDRLTNKGVLIVSAFDNSGICSYPAGFSKCDRS